MFGYVNANRTILSSEDNITYQRYYCGLCQQLHKDAGFKGQLLLNYDLTFMVILLSGLHEIESDTSSFRCIIHPVSKKHAYINDTTKYASAMDIMLSYHSLVDTYNDDGNFISGQYALALKKHYANAKEKYPVQANAIETYIASLSDMESKNETNIDMVSNLTGEMLGVIFSEYKHDEWSKELYSLGFYLGKFIYIIDAYEDLKKDIRKGNYNPLRFMQENSPSEYETFIRVTLTSLMAECAKSFERLPIIQDASILRNIIYSGVWTKYEYLKIKIHKKDKE